MSTTKRLVTAIAVVLVGFFAADLSAQTTYPLQQYTTFSGTNNGWNYNMGYQFTANASGLTVTQLGCVMYDTNPRFVALWDFQNPSSPTKVGQVTTSGASGNLQWQWGNLASAVSLVSGRNYAVVVCVNSQGGCYYSGVSGTPWAPSGDISYVNAVGYNGSNNNPDLPPTNWSSGNNQYGIADIGYVKGAKLTVSATAGTQQLLYPSAQGPGGNGVVVGRFSITCNNILSQSGTMTSMTVQGSGSGNHATAYTSVQIFRDIDDNGLINIGTDIQIGTTATALDGPSFTKVFAIQAGQQVVPASEVRKYLIVVKLNASPLFDETFTYKIQDLAVAGTTVASGVPSASMTGFKITYTPFTMIDHSPDQNGGLAGNAYATGDPFIVQDFEITYPQGADRTITSVTFSAFGTGDDSLDYTSVVLYRDADNNGLFDPLIDVEIEALVAFPADDTAMSFQFPLGERQIAQGEAKRYLLVVTFDTIVPDGNTYQTQLTDLVETTVGLGFSPYPIPVAGPTPGLVLHNYNLNGALIGPTVATVVNNNDQGLLNRGLVLATVDIVTYGYQWSVTELKFRASGTGNDSTAFNSVVLMEDLNTNGFYDGIPQDWSGVTGATVASFDADDGLYTAILSDPVFPVNPLVPRRFFLVVKLVGTASPGDSFNAELESITASAMPPAGQGIFLPSLPSVALVIDHPTITVGLGSGSPASTSVEKGDDFAYVLAKFRFTVSGSPAIIDGIVLTSHGLADFTTDLANSNGMELFLDNGNGLFDPEIGLGGGDTPIFAGPGGYASTTCTFSSPITLANGTSRDIWVRINVLAGAGGSVPDTFQVSIDTPASLILTTDPGSTVIISQDAPVSGILSVVQYSIESFSPLLSYQEGGALITVKGTGFTAPISLMIGGIPCPGTAVVSPDGRTISGLMVPPGDGHDLSIRLKTGGLSERTLPMKFSYAGGTNISSFDHTATCSVSAQAGYAWFMLPVAILGVLALRRRKAARR